MRLAACVVVSIGCGGSPPNQPDTSRSYDRSTYHIPPTAPKAPPTPSSATALGPSEATTRDAVVTFSFGDCAVAVANLDGVAHFDGSSFELTCMVNGSDWRCVDKSTDNPNPNAAASSWLLHPLRDFDGVDPHCRIGALTQTGDAYGCALMDDKAAFKLILVGVGPSGMATVRLDLFGDGGAHGARVCRGTVEIAQ